MRSTGLALAVLGLGLSSAAAQNDSFETEMEAALTNAGRAASLLRCTALFRAFRLYAGESSEIGATAAARETDLAVAGVVIWQDETGETELDTAFETIVPMVGAATDLFLARMSGNLDAGESVFDAGIETELVYCNALHGGIAGQSDG